MESNYGEESTNSSEEVMDHYLDDQENNDLGVGRSYECVFCKRGFNTAQALGGHMNIHRKDRARNKPNNSTKQEPSRFINSRRQNQDQPHLITYATYLPAAVHVASNNSTLYESERGRHQPSTDPAADADPRDWRMRLSSIVDGNRQEKELDLELRLGYD